MTDPTPQGGQSVCKWCGAAIKPWTDRYVDMAGGELCQDGGQEQFARRHSPAERVIEVAPQGEIPDTVILTGEQFREMQASLTAAREELDRAQEALRDMLVIAEFDRWHCASTAGRQIAFRKAEEALKPVSDRQPEGDTK